MLDLVVMLEWIKSSITIFDMSDKVDKVNEPHPMWRIGKNKDVEKKEDDVENDEDEEKEDQVFPMFDFDRTVLSKHTGGRLMKSKCNTWADKYITRHARMAMAHSFAHWGKIVIVSYNDKHNESGIYRAGESMIQDMVFHRLSTSSLFENTNLKKEDIVVVARHPDYARSWCLNFDKRFFDGSKRWHMAEAVVRLEEMGVKVPEKSKVLLVDDSKDNVDDVVKHGYMGLHVDGKEGFVGKHWDAFKDKVGLILD